MSTAQHKPVAPFYAAAATWLAYGLFFPLYSAKHFAVVIVASILVFAIVSALCKNSVEKKAEEPVKEKKVEEKPTGNPELDKMIKDGNLAIAEMKRLNDNIQNEKISAEIEHLESTSSKIFAQVKLHPEKLPQIRKFMNYYLPTTLKLLNAYDRLDSQGVAGDNIDSTMKKVDAMMSTIVVAFDKQLDSLFGADAMDISSDITVLENMMAREGLSGQQMHATEDSDTATLKL